LALQSEVAGAITRELSVQLTPGERALLSRKQPVHPEVYRLYSLGRFYQNKHIGWATARALENFDAALRLDPEFAPAWVALAESSIFGYPPAPSMQRARDAAKRALALDPDLAEAHVSMGLVQMYWDWDWNAAESSFQTAIRLNPNSLPAHFRYSQFLSALGRFDEALTESDRALLLDPRADAVLHSRGRILYFARRYTEAEAALRRSIEINPDTYWARFFLILTLEQMNRFDDAVREARPFLKNSAAPPDLIPVISARLSPRGRNAGLRAAVEEILRKYDGPVGSSSLVFTYAALGNKDAAFLWLEKSFTSHTRDLVYLKVEPQVDPLRSDPRFAAFLTRLNFPD
jgi:tetratricopeptide (TPR) repeat protein